MPTNKIETRQCVCRTFGAGWTLSDPEPDCEWCSGKGEREHPTMRYTLLGSLCPKCGFNGGREDLQAFDVCFADHGCVFCPECHQEIAT